MPKLLLASRGGSDDFLTLGLWKKDNRDGETYNIAGQEQLVGWKCFNNYS
jgi:hypothetical protein